MSPSKSFRLAAEKRLKEIKSKRNMTALGKEVVRTMIRRTQGEGRGVRDFRGRRAKLKALHRGPPKKNSTVERRKRFKALSHLTTPETSNLTMTGRLMKAISYKVKGLGSLLIFIKQKERHKAEHVQTARPFMNLSSTELVALLKFFKRLTRR